MSVGDHVPPQSSQQLPPLAREFSDFPLAQSRCEKQTARAVEELAPKCLQSTGNCFICCSALRSSANCVIVELTKNDVKNVVVTCLLGGGFKVGVAVWFLQASGGQNHSTSLR